MKKERERENGKPKQKKKTSKKVRKGKENLLSDKHNPKNHLKLAISYICFHFSKWKSSSPVVVNMRGATSSGGADDDGMADPTRARRNSRKPKCHFLAFFSYLHFDLRVDFAFTLFFLLKNFICFFLYLEWHFYDSINNVIDIHFDF